MYVASWSGGKDSTASIILAHEHNEPLDLIIFSEVMFDNDTSGELPEHMDFVYKCINRFEQWGYKTEILHSDKTYMDCFYSINQGRIVKERKGMYYGFPMAGRCLINTRCKVKPIIQFDNRNPDAIHYVGIAVDEPKRLERLKPNTISLLAKYNISESDAYNLCESYDMISPIYQFSTRGGCWFCPNATDNQLRHLRNNHQELWNKLLELEDIPNKVGHCWNTLTKSSIHQKEQQFRYEEAQMSIFDFLGNN